MMRTMALTGFLVTGAAALLAVPTAAADCDDVIVGQCHPDPDQCYYQFGLFLPNGQFVAGYSYREDLHPQYGYCESSSRTFCIGALGVGAVYYSPNGSPLVGV